VRIADDSNYRNLLLDIQRIAERMQASQNQVSSGKRLTKPSDDPSAAADVVNVDAARAASAQYLDNAGTANSRLQIADNALDGVQQVTDRIRTLALMAQNGTSSPSLSVEEIAGLRDQLLSYANTEFEGQYMFAGSNTDSAAYDKASNGTITYAGNSDEVKLQVGKASTLQSQIPGDQVFSGSVDIFQTLTDLVAAMTSGSTGAIQTQVTKLEQFSQNVSSSRTKLGALMNGATAAQNELKQSDLTLVAHLSKLQDADLAQALSEFTQAQNALQAATAVGAKVNTLSILDYLK
jgi:flagellar hook-associated protein 3 FlgL